ncbi:MAG TPA: linear amide C-N hydrolase [Caldithrix abyssi]|uniref:Linear amide C-N hydrolase n=1 Tax=Caldithrix abyssi TaxID=187145 RepID=A0A7V4TYY9_CALAY|nr:linear amide C-N hydrolase [Caldithrix abyssi]
MKSIKYYGFLFTLAALLLLPSGADSCTRVLHVFKEKGLVITGRNMDWYVRYPSAFWKFPRGMHKTGLTKANPARWVSKYGSLVLVQTAAGQSAATDGMNEKGLVANLLYLAETEYPKRDVSKYGVTTSIYIQYLLDNFATVKEAVDALLKDAIQIVPVPIPNIDKPSTLHISISDKTGDSAIIEFLGGKTVIHHSKDYDVMTNSPIFEKQLALYEYWDEIGGNTFLPGTRRSADRFVRAKYYNKMLPKAKDYREAVAAVMSVLRNTSSPFGDPDPNKPNISKTQWRIVDDQTNLVTFYESTISPNVVWVKMKEFDFSKDSAVKSLDLEDFTLNGDVTKAFKKSEPIQYAKP